MELAGYLEAMMEQGAGDLHLQAESPPRIRVAGQLRALDTPPLSDDQIREIMRQMAFEDAQVRLDQERSVDFSFEMPGRARFRVNASYERDRLSMAFRLIPIEVPPFEECHEPGRLSAAL